MSDSVRPHKRQSTRLPVPGILQARTLPWVAISFSSAWKWKVKVKSLSHVQLLETRWNAAHQAPPSMGFSRQEYWSRVPLPSPLSGCKWYYIINFNINVFIAVYRIKIDFFKLACILHYVLPSLICCRILFFLANSLWFSL